VTERGKVRDVRYQCSFLIAAVQPQSHSSSMRFQTLYLCHLCHMRAELLQAFPAEALHRHLLVKLSKLTPLYMRA